MKKTNDHPGEEVRNRHLSFIQANYEQLAIAAYKGFLEDGRGMVILTDEDFLSKPVGVVTEYRQAYMASGNRMFTESGSRWPGDKESGWVRDYDPERCMLVSFSRTDGGVSSYKIEGVGNGIPRLAFERSNGGRK